MKKFTFIIIALFFSKVNLFGQQATIIDPKSMTVPRYTDLSAIQTAITAPQTGMMVYNIATQTNWTYNGDNWINSAGAGSYQWVSNQRDIFYESDKYSWNGNLPIPAFVPIQSSCGTPAISTINVPLSGTILNSSAITISMNIDHTKFHHLRITLIDPSGGEILLKASSNFTRSGSISSNENLQFNEKSTKTWQIDPVYTTLPNSIKSGIYAVPQLSALVGKAINGTWQLKLENCSEHIPIINHLSKWSIKFGKYVGVNETLPQYDLDVNGTSSTIDLKVKDDLIVGRNIGVGMDNPSAPLQFSNEDNPQKIVLYDARSLPFDSRFTGFGTLAGNLLFNTVRTGGNMPDIKDFIFNSGSQYGYTSFELLRIKGNGNVGIGTSNPTNKLSVNGNSDFNGNVGIGTANPSELLEVNGKTKTSAIQVTSGAAANNILVSDANGNATWQNPPWTQSGTTINYSVGNVGILTTTPTSTLDVNGSIATKIIKINTFTNVNLDETGSIWYFSSNPNVTLPIANSCENRRYVLVNSSSSTINLSTHFIDFYGTQIFTINANSSIEIISDGTNWLQIK